MFDECVIECGGDYSDYKFCLVGHQYEVVPIICVHIRSGSSSLKKLMVELFIWVVVMLAISL